MATVTFTQIEELRQQIEPEVERITGDRIMPNTQRLFHLVLALQVADVAKIDRELLVDLIVRSGWSERKTPQGKAEAWVVAEYRLSKHPSGPSQEMGTEAVESGDKPKPRHLLGYCPSYDAKIPRRQRIPGNACPFCGRMLPRSGQSFEIGDPPSEVGATVGVAEQTDTATLHVIYLGGFSGHEPRGGNLRQSWHESWTLILSLHGVEVRKKENKLLAQEFTVRSASWTDLKYASFEDAGTRPDVVSLALFGVLGLSSTNPATLITIGYPDGEVIFLVRTPLYEFRRFARAMAQDQPEAGERLHIGAYEGNETSPETQTEGGVVDQLERAASLLERGLITKDDYDRIKADLIDGL